MDSEPALTLGRVGSLPRASGLQEKGPQAVDYIRPLQLVIMFWSTTCILFLENVKFEKYWVKCPHQLFEKPGFQKQILGCNRYAKSNYLSVIISENLQEMHIVHSTDQYTLIEQSVNHKKYSN